jgi:hypothetical protein
MTSVDRSKSSDPRLVVVLGMHRSGTSTIARSLQVMGVELGSNFLPPDQHNERGYWEDTDIHALNVEMLEAIDSDWHHLTSVSQADVSALRNLGYVERASKILRHKIVGTQVFGLKDPRITKLLLFWTEVFKSCNIQVNYVLVIRNPLSIVQSLEKRDGLNRIHSFYLWLEYCLAALDFGLDRLSAVIDYDRLIQSPKNQLKTLAERLDLCFDLTKMQIFETDFLNPKFRHSIHKIDALKQDASCPALVREVYTTLLSVAAGELQLDDSKFHDEKSSWPAELRPLQPLMKHADSLARQIATFRKIEHSLKFPSLTISLRNVGRSIFRTIFRKLPFGDRIRQSFRH